MSRLSWFAAAAVLAVGGVAFAEGQAEIAAKLNEEGKQLMFGNDFAGATAKFRDAVARAPEPKYFYNLCMSLYQEGKFDEAFTACNAVGQNNPSAEQKDKADKLTGKIKDEAKAQGLELHMGGGGGGATNVPPDPNGNPPNGNPPNGNPPDPNGGPGPVGGPPPNAPDYRPAVGRPPTQAIFMATKPDHHYTWSLGMDFYGGGGAIGATDYYGAATGGIRLKADYMINPPMRLGVEGYVQVSHWGASSNQVATNANVSSLDVVDFGAAAYKHFCLAAFDSLCLTPLVGAHISTLSPESDQTTNSDGSTTAVFNYISAGARAELALSVAFGRRQEHVFNVAAGVNYYTKVLGGPSDDPNGMAVGLDAGGAFGYLGVGYTYRFNTPFGAMPFVTLE